MLLVKHLLLLRIKQAYRILIDSGGGIIIVLPIFLLLLIPALNNFCQHRPFGFHLFIASLILIMHTSRKDKVFLKGLGKLHYLYLLFEYLLLIILLSLFHLAGLRFDMKWYLAEWVALGLAFYLDRFQKKDVLFIKVAIIKMTSLIPAHAFEWKMGIRRYFFLFAIIYFIALGISPFLNVFPFFVAYLIIFVFDLYRENENKEILLSYGSVKVLVKKRATATLAFANVLLLPSLVITLVVHSQNWLINIYAVLVFNAAILYALFLKYNTNNLINDRRHTLPKMLIFFMACPILPIAIWLGINEFNKAKWNLTKLLN